MRLFGRDWDRRTLLRHVGDVRQVGGAQAAVLDDGPERGVRAIDVRTGTGFLFTVLPDRGLDVWRAEHQGASLCWQSSTGPVAPAFFEPQGLGWLRGFYGGMIVTCGLTHLGAPCRDQGKDLGLHGRASYTPAYDVGVSQGWEGEEYRIEVRGKIREASVFGEHVVLSRRIRTALGQDRFVLTDVVENCGHEPVPHTILYHVNAGFPVLDETAELLSASDEARPADAEAAREGENYARFPPPTDGFAERCTFHRLRADREGIATVALVNRSFRGGRGIGCALRFPVAQLPCFTTWKMMGAGTYVLGLEPGNVTPAPRDRMRQEGRLPMLAPGESRRYEIEFAVLASAEDIRRVEQEIKGR